MNDFCLKGKIVEIIPVAVYENRVYTQNVIVELENNKKIDVFDPFKRCKNKMKGKKIGFKLHAFTFQPIIKNEPKEKKIIPDPFEYGPYADIYGYLEKILFNKPENELILDVGYGKIIIYADDTQINDVSEKDYVVVKGARLNLSEIKEIEYDVL